MNREVAFFNRARVLVFKDSGDHFQNGIVRLLPFESEQVLDLFCEVSKTIDPSTGLDVFINHFKQVLALKNLDLPSEQIELSLDNFSSSLFGQKYLLSQFNSVSNSYTLRKTLIGRQREFSILSDIDQTHGLLVRTDSTLPIENDVVSYDEEYFDGGLSNKGYGFLSEQEWRIEKGFKLAKWVESEFKRIRPNVRSNEITVLDLGCGFGHFLAGIKSLNFKGYGFEPSKYAAEIAATISGCQISSDSVNIFPNNSFSIVTMWDLIEHPVNPAQLLSTIYSKLDSNGLLFIKTPNLNSLESIVFEGNYHSLKVEHLNYFSPRSLQDLLILCGFRISHLSTRSHMFDGFLSGKFSRSSESMALGSDIFCIAVK